MSFTASNILKTMGHTHQGLGSAGSVVKGKQAAGTQGTFGTVLQQQSDRVGKAAEAAGEGKSKRQAEAEKAAGDLISNALILPMLKQLRRSPWGENTVFSRGIGEKAFGPQFDIQISDRIAHSPRLGLKTALSERLMNRGRAEVKQASPGTTNDKGIDLHG